MEKEEEVANKINHSFEFLRAVKDVASIYVTSWTVYSFFFSSFFSVSFYTLWLSNPVLVFSILYVLPTVHFLYILSVWPSFGGEILCANLGFKPIHLLIFEWKLCYVSSILQDDFPGIEFVQILMREQIFRKSSPLYLDLLCRFESLVTFKALSSYWSAQILHQISTLSSLASLPSPRSWWSKQSYVCEDSCSRTLSEFCCSNVRLDNRDDSMSLMAVPNHQKRVVVCPAPPRPCCPGNHQTLLGHGCYLTINEFCLHGLLLLLLLDLWEEFWARVHDFFLA